MTNTWDVATKPKGSGFLAVIRRADMAKGYYLSERGEPMCFASEMEAEIAGLRHLIHLWNTETRFEITAGPVPHTIALEEKAFGTVTSKRGRKSKVVRKRRRDQAKQKAIAQAEASSRGKVI